MAGVRELCFSTLLLYALLSTQYEPVQGQDEQVLSVTFLPTNGFKSRTLAPNKGVHCVSYYAKTLEDDHLFLDTRLEDADTGKTISASLHTDKVDKTERLIYFEVEEQKKPFKVVIEREIGQSNDVKIAIIDVEVTEGGCLDKSGSCKFELNSCGYTSIKDLSKEWDRVTPVSEDDSGITYPEVDSTTESSRGHYTRVYLKDKTERAKLVSGIIKANTSCVRFSYSIVGDGKLLVGTATQGLTHTLENDDTSLKTSRLGWDEVEVELELENTDSYKLVFEAQSGFGEAWIALDDVEVNHRPCYSPGHSFKAPESVVLDEGLCDFETGSACTDKWRPGPTNHGFTWLLKSSENIVGLPKFDHTHGDAISLFQYVWVDGKDSTNNIVLNGPDFEGKQDSSHSSNCISFWYFMHGPSAPRLSVFFRYDSSRDGDVLWTREGNQGPAWNQGFVNVPNTGADKGHVQFVVTNTARGMAAIDDVVAYDGPCPSSENLCSFENGNNCGYDLNQWQVHQAKDLAQVTGLTVDHSTRTETGSYVHLETSSEKRTSLVSPMFPPTAGRCLKFYYHIKGERANNFALDVFLRLEGGGLYYLIDVADADDTETWSFAEINVISGQHFQIEFGTRRGVGVVSLDDIQLSTTACHESYGCDFEQGLCSWSTNLDDHSNLDWQITAGHLPEKDIGPHKDVTLNNQFGHFLFLQTSVLAQPGDRAILTSQEIREAGCLTFYYSMIGEGTGTLAVNFTFLDNDSTPEELWSKTGSQGKSPEWRRAAVDLSGHLTDKPKPFRLHLIGTVGTSPESDIGVDEIKIHQSRCSNVKDDGQLMVTCKRETKRLGHGHVETETQIKRSQVCDFLRDCPHGDDEENCGTCKFRESNYWCGYVDVSEGEVTWTHSQEVPQQHIADIPERRQDSLGTASGGFLLVDRMDAYFPGGMIADLETSHYLGPTPPSCQLHFSYFSSAFYADHPTLVVVLRQSGEETVIFRIQEWQNRWITTTVDIGSIDSRFKIAFLGYKHFGKREEADVAIDDIGFKNCNYPDPAPHCTESEFQCARGSCVDLTRVCDFTDDCGDSSDEENCGNQPVVLQTSLEEGFGEWTVETGEDSTPWMIQAAGHFGSGLEYPQSAHPGRDHTLGISAGHFMYKAPAQRDPARLISPILIADPDLGKCHLRLYYFIMGTYDLQRLRVYVKTTLLGEEKRVLDKFTSHGQVWTRADIQIEETEKPFQIVIEGTRGAWGTFLGVDDISVWNCKRSPDTFLPEGSAVIRPSCTANQFQCGDDSCISGRKVCNLVSDCKDGSDEKDCGNCDFETDLCGWHDESNSVFSWTHRASSQEPQPFRDATKDSDGKGHFLLLETHSAGVDETDAILMSPILPETDPSCQLSLSVYVVKNQGYIGGLQISAQMSYQAGTEKYEEIPLAEKVDVESGKWARLTFHLGFSSGYRRVIIRHRYNERYIDSFIAIDDLEFKNCKPRSGIKSIASTTAPLECKFDESVCQFHPSYLTSDYHWVIRGVSAHNHRGEETPVLMADLWRDSQEGRYASITSDWIYETNTDLCIQFWYMTFGTILKVKVYHEGYSGGEYKPAFTHHGYEYMWTLGQADVAATDKPFIIEFQAVTGRHSHIAYVSDVTVSRNSCPKDLCDFERDDCGFTTDQHNTWGRDSQVSRFGLLLPSGDHTTDDVYGYFMHVVEKPELGQQAVSMVGPDETQPADHHSCVYFWYHLRGPEVGRLNVKLMRPGVAQDRLVFSMGGEQGDHWLQGRFTLHRDTGKYNLVFEAELTGGVKGSIAVDDIKKEHGACPQEGTCDFDRDMCGYTSHTYSDYSEEETESRWIRLTNKYSLSSYGPQNDHTGRRLDGGYAFSDQFTALGRGRESTTRMVSPYVKSTPESCLSFWYYFRGRARGILEVSIGNVKLMSVKTFGLDWRHSGKIMYKSDTPYQIMFEARQDGNRWDQASLAVDDIVVGDCEDLGVPTPAPAPVPKKPLPSLVPHLPVPDERDIGHYSKTNCYAYCMHFKSCFVQRKHFVKCICMEGYTGITCEVPLPPETHGGIVDVSGGQDDSQAEKTAAAAQGGAGQGSNGWKVAVGVVVTIVCLALLAFAVLVFLVRTNRVPAPARLQSLLPSLLASPGQDGITNPAYQFSPSADNGEGILNPVYAVTKNDRPKV